MTRIIIAALCLMAGTASAAEITVISGGAVEPGLEAFAQLVRRDLGHELKILYNTAPQIAKRLAAGEVYDILISPPATIESAVKEGKVVADTRVPVGRVGAGIIVRAGAALPDVATVDALKRALLAADSVVYNTASTGIYLDKLFAKMGIAEALQAKTTRYPTGAAEPAVRAPAARAQRAHCRSEFRRSDARRDGERARARVTCRRACAPEGAPRAQRGRTT